MAAEQEDKNDSSSQPPLYTHPLESTLEQFSAIASAAPFVGGPLATIAKSIAERRQNRRLSSFLEQVVEDMNRLETRLNEDFLSSEEFEDLAEEILSNAADTRQEEKLEAYRRIFLNALTAKDASYSGAARVIRFVRRWDPEHLVMLRLLHDPLPFFEESGTAKEIVSGLGRKFDDQLQKLTGWHKSMVERVWCDLERDHIHHFNTQIGGMKRMEPDRLSKGLTGFGRQVAEFLQEP